MLSLNNYRHNQDSEFQKNRLQNFKIHQRNIRPNKTSQVTPKKEMVKRTQNKIAEVLI